MGKLISLAESAAELARQHPDVHLARRYAQSSATMRAAARRARWRLIRRVLLTCLALAALAALLVGCGGLS